MGERQQPMGMLLLPVELPHDKNHRPQAKRRARRRSRKSATRDIQQPALSASNTKCREQQKHGWEKRTSSGVVGQKESGVGANRPHLQQHEPKAQAEY